jgi:hypothetical protein
MQRERYEAGGMDGLLRELVQVTALEALTSS